MIFDALLQFSDAQAVTAAAASTNYVDLKKARNIGIGEDLYIVLIIDVAMTDSGSDSTLTVDLQGDSTSTFTPDGTQTLFVIPAVSAIGTKFVQRVSPGLAAAYEFLQLYYTPNNGNLSAGSFTAFICRNQDNAADYYASGFSVA